MTHQPKAPKTIDPDRALALRLRAFEREIEAHADRAHEANAPLGFHLDAAVKALGLAVDTLERGRR